MIKCRAAVCWKANEPMKIETIQVEAPMAGEVRVKMIANSICHSDIHGYAGHIDEAEFPCILGHEGTAKVESVGEGVTDFKPGDYVLTIFLAQCGECHLCRKPHTNLCTERKMSRLTGNTSRFKTLSGQSIYHFGGVSTLSEYTVIMASQLVKIPATSKMDQVCLLSCGFPTGFGSAINVAKVTKHSTVAVWGLGAIGLAAITGARYNGASMIIAVDIKQEKQEIAKQFGCTHFLNPLKCNVVEEITRLTGNGIDFAIECSGNVMAAKTAVDSLSPWGTAALIGVYTDKQTFPFHPGSTLSGKKITGAYFGGYKPRRDVPQLVQLANANEINLEPFFTHRFSLDDVNTSFQLLMKGDALRSVVIF